MLLGIIIFTGEAAVSQRWVYRLANQIMFTYDILEDERTPLGSWMGYNLQRAFKYVKKGSRKLTLSTQHYTTE